jgi:hypothetical protein
MIRKREKYLTLPGIETRFFRRPVGSLLAVPTALFRLQAQPVHTEVYLSLFISGHFEFQAQIQSRIACFYLYRAALC